MSIAAIIFVLIGWVCVFAVCFGCILGAIICTRLYYYRAAFVCAVIAALAAIPLLTIGL